MSFCGYLCGIRVGSVRRVDARSDSFLIGSSRPHCSTYYNNAIRDYSVLRSSRTSRLAFAVRGSRLRASTAYGAGRAIVRVTGAAIGLALLHEASDGNMVRDHHWRRFMPKAKPPKGLNLAEVGDALPCSALKATRTVIAQVSLYAATRFFYREIVWRVCGV